MLAFCRRAISSYFGCFQVPGEGVWVRVLVTESLEAGVDGAETRASFELTVWLMFAEGEKENKWLAVVDLLEWRNRVGCYLPR